jgi:phage tail-like protein
MGPVLAFRFNILIYNGQASPVMRAQSVNGLTVEMVLSKTPTIGGEVDLPKQVSYNNLVVKRAMLQWGDPFSMNASKLLTDLQVKRVDMCVYLTNSFGMYTRSWNVLGAYPIKWSMSEVDASSNAVIMETIEFKYKSLQEVTIWT